MRRIPSNSVKMPVKINNHKNLKTVFHVSYEIIIRVMISCRSDEFFRLKRSGACVELTCLGEGVRK